MKTITAIIGIIILDCWAIANGIDGILLITAIGIISGLGGYPILKSIKDAYDVSIVRKVYNK
jgi:hypothetical protein